MDKVKIEKNPDIQRQYLIGIDPGVSTGICLYDRDSKRICELKTTDFWNGFDWVLENAAPGTTEIIIEAPVKSAMYARQEGNAAKGGKGYGNRMMSNAASNAREAELLADGLERANFKVHRVRPKRHKSADGSSGKISAAEIKEETGYEASTNQHTRDAIMLVYGK
jgi:hypothetical protein